MALVNEMSAVTAVEQLDLFKTALVQTSIVSKKSFEVRPLSLLNTGGHVDFIITSAINEYTKLDETTIYAKFNVSLSRKDNTNVEIADWDKVSIVNNFLNSLFTQVDLSIGETQTTLSLQTYPYRSYFELLLGSKEESRNVYLSNCGFFKDEMDLANTPITSRQELISYKRPRDATTDVSIFKGKTCELEGKLHLDLAMQPKSVLGGTTLKIKLVPNKPEYYFMISDDNLTAKIEFQDIHLNVVKETVTNNIVTAHRAALNVSPARYIISRNEVRSFTIDNGVTGKNLENVITGNMPRSIFVALISNDAYNGNYKKNPYYFHHYNVNSICCYLNGEPYPLRALTPDFKNNIYLREYFGLLRSTNQLNNNVKTFISKKDYKNGYTIFAFDLSADHSEGYYTSGYVNQPKQGVLRIEIKFSKATTETINALIFSEFDNQINILEDRQAITDYH